MEGWGGCGWCLRGLGCWLGGALRLGVVRVGRASARFREVVETVIGAGQDYKGSAAIGWPAARCS